VTPLIPAAQDAIARYRFGTHPTPDSKTAIATGSRRIALAVRPI